MSEFLMSGPLLYGAFGNSRERPIRAPRPPRRVRAFRESFQKHFGACGPWSQKEKETSARRAGGQERYGGPWCVWCKFCRATAVCQDGAEGYATDSWQNEPSWSQPSLLTVLIVFDDSLCTTPYPFLGTGPGNSKGGFPDTLPSFGCPIFTLRFSEALAHVRVVRRAGADYIVSGASLQRCVVRAREERGQRWWVHVGQGATYVPSIVVLF